MSWAGAAEFFAMGGYAAYVWGSVAVVAAAMIMEPLLVRARWRRAARDLRRSSAASGKAQARAPVSSAEVRHETSL